MRTMKDPFMRRLAGAAFLLGLAAVPGAAAAQAVDADGPGQHFGERLFERLDTDGDGAVSRQEMRDGRARHRARIDANGDGSVTEAEMRAAMTARVSERVSKRFARLDSDGDGRIAAAEFDAADQRRFARLDANGDGRVTRAEFDDARARMRAR